MQVSGSIRIRRLVPGKDAVLYTVVPSVPVVRRLASGDMLPVEVGATVYKTVGDGVPVRTDDYRLYFRRQGIDKLWTLTSVRDGVAAAMTVTVVVTSVDWELRDDDGHVVASAQVPVMADGNNNGSNLLTGTSSGDGWSGLSDVTDGVMTVENTHIDEYELETVEVALSPMFALEQGKWYTLSLRALCSEFVDRLEVAILRSGATAMSRTLDIISDVEQLHVVQFRCDTPSASDYRLYISCANGWFDETAELRFREVMLQEGYNTAPEWHPSDADLLATGIDIANRRITVTADTFRLRNNLGQTMAVFTADGRLDTRLIRVEDLIMQRAECYDARGNMVSSLNRFGRGEFIIYRPGGSDSPVPWVRMCPDSATDSAIQGYDSAGNIVWTLGSSGDINKVATKYNLIPVTVVAEGHPDIAKPEDITSQTRTIHRFESASSDSFVSTAGSGRYKDYDGKYLTVARDPLDQLIAGEYIRSAVFYEAAVSGGYVNVNTGLQMPYTRRKYTFDADGNVTVASVRCNT